MIIFWFIMLILFFLLVFFLFFSDRSPKNAEIQEEIKRLKLVQAKIELQKQQEESKPALNDVTYIDPALNDVMYIDSEGRKRYRFSDTGNDVTWGNNVTKAEEQPIKCPRCGSIQITANKKGFGLVKAGTGALLTGGIGLLAGFIGSGKIKITCLKCGYSWKPRK